MAEARATYEQALALAPTATEILVNYGAFLYTQGDFAAAARVLERVPPPPPPRALVALAESYRLLGRMADAQATRATAERLYPSDPGVRQLMDYVRRGATRNERLAMNALRPLLLLIAGVAVYARTFGVPFVFDDVHAIVQNLRIREWSLDLFQSDRPLVELTLALNYALGGLHVRRLPRGQPGPPSRVRRCCCSTSSAARFA